jgi:Zn-dependent protease
LVCDQCRSLVHANELQQISSHAKSLESSEQFLEARDVWQQALKLLPEASKQAVWIREHVAELERTASAWSELGHAKEGKKKAIAASVLAFVVSFSLFIAFESAYGGWKFGVGFSALILIHEFGHFLDVRRRGMKADLPIFMPGLGAFVRFRSLNITGDVRAGVALAGPFAGLISAAACAALWYGTGDRYWASLAQSAAWLNLLNLAPVWILDGGQAAAALGKMQRALILIASLAMWRVTGESVYFVVAAGALFRTFVKDTPEKPSPAITAYFLAVLVLLGAVMYLVPGKGFGL